MNILITGAFGFIGRNLTDFLIKSKKLFLPKHKELDLTDYEDVRTYISENKINYIIHCANTNDVVHRVSSYDVLDRNLRMFYNLEQCQDLYERMFYFGSGAEYDMQHYVPLMKEEYFGCYIPQDPYGFSKYTMSRITEHSEKIYDLRLFGVYGRYEEWKRRFISNNIYNVMSGREMTIHKHVKFDYLYIDDLCKIVEKMLTMDLKYHHYNICTSKPMDLFSVAEVIGEVMGVSCGIKVAEEGWKLEYSGSNDRLLEEIGGFEFTGLKKGIKELVDYYRNNAEAFRG